MYLIRTSDRSPSQKVRAVSPARATRWIFLGHIDRGPEAVSGLGRTEVDLEARQAAARFGDHRLQGRVVLKGHVPKLDFHQGLREAYRNYGSSTGAAGPAAPASVANHPGMAGR